MRDLSATYMQDDTEQYRRARQAELNSKALEDKVLGSPSRARLEAQYGQVWSTDEVREHFELIGFMAPYVVAKEKATGKKGSLEFQHSPRFYFNWIAD